MTAIVTDEQARQFAEQLYEARRTRTPIEPFTDALPDLGMEDGYAIQQHLVARLLADGESIVGYKLGLTSLPMQQLLGVDSPDFGPVFASGVFRDGAVLPVDRFIAPRVEAEIGVILATDLTGPHCTPAQALAATAGLVAAVEIVDSRIGDWRIKLADTVADLASSGAIALSRWWSRSTGSTPAAGHGVHEERRGRRDGCGGGGAGRSAGGGGVAGQHPGPDGRDAARRAA